MSHPLSRSPSSWLGAGSLWAVCLAFLLFLPHAARAQSPDPVTDLMQQMTVEEKVGQLFVVAFVGDSADPSSDVARLIKEYNAGGVVLLAANNNFRNGDDTPAQVANLTNGLQALAFSRSDRPGIPLFVAIDHEGDGWPYSRIRDGTTPLPSAMAIGATWDPANAEEVGRITGRELSAMGINLLLGPVVDVLNNPRMTARGDIGTRAFGGDPFWVSQMGRAYIRGVHEGSDGRMATVAKHFPGHGGSDRLPDQEVAVVDKSLSELQRIELPPFFAVTQIDNDQGLATADALMSSHIRYRGFQGNIRQLTPPISFDPEGMRAILSLPEFAEWRARGGLIVSDSLGVDAVRKYFDPQLRTFPHNLIAKEAFLAGNDLLILSQFALRDVWLDQFSNIQDTIQYFRSLYQAEPDFRDRVDEAVAKILRLKMKLYPEFKLPAVQVDMAKAKTEVGQGQETVAQIARQAMTLVFPQSADELRIRMPSPPRRDEDILIFTDVRDNIRECFLSDCQPFALIPVDAVAQMMIKLYGPESTNQVDPARIQSRTFAELKDLMTGELAVPEGSPEPTPTPVPEGHSPAELEKLIQDAEWIVFAMLDVNPERFPDSDAVRLFLARGPTALYDKKVVVLAFNGPYYLDTTEVNKLTAYYAVYSKQPAFIEAAVRALFGDYTPTGASPVSVEGINYDLAQALEPDPAQTIPLELIEPATGTPLEAPVTIRVRAGPILDHNGHPVPDNSPVQFQTFYRDQGVDGPNATAETLNGIAEASLQLDRGGAVDVTASSNAANTSKVAHITVIAPTPTPTDTPPPTATLTPGPTEVPPTASPEPTATPTQLAPYQGAGQGGGASGRSPIGASDLGLALIGVFAAGGLGLAVRRPVVDGPSTWLRIGLLALVAGLAGYLIYGLSARVVGDAWTGLRPWAAGAVAFVFGIVPAVWSSRDPQAGAFNSRRPRLRS
jgi:beta-N-acetylhexosaminidase